MAKVGLIGITRKNPKHCLGTILQWFLLQLTKAYFLGGKKKKAKTSFKNPRIYQYMSCTCIRTAEKEIVPRFRNRALT